EEILPAKVRTSNGTPRPEGATDILDWKVALERVGGRPKFLREMAQLFIKECDKLMPEIREAIDKADAPTLRRAAHTLKGSAACFAAKPMVEAALRLEMMG